jgi:fructose-1,6-bisphosphatase/inositol monophosphatase family enzyme
VTTLTDLLPNTAMQDTSFSTDFVSALAPALRQAAAIARSLEGRVSNRPKAGEATPVKAALTIADTASQEALLVPLLEHFPQVMLEAEEDTVSVSRFPESGDGLVVIDPIDGTLRFYLEAQGPYAVMIGLAIGDRYEASLVALPREDLCFDAVRGRGARVGSGDTAARGVKLGETSGNRILVSHNLPTSACERLRDLGYEVAAASGGAISVAPLIPGVCAGLRLVRENAEGVSIRGRIGALIAAEAGALVTGASGPFPSDIRTPAPALLIATNQNTLAHLQDALSTVQD